MEGKKKTTNRNIFEMNFEWSLYRENLPNSAFLMQKVTWSVLANLIINHLLYAGGKHVCAYVCVGVRLMHARTKYCYNLKRAIDCISVSTSHGGHFSHQTLCLWHVCLAFLVCSKLSKRHIPRASMYIIFFAIRMHDPGVCENQKKSVVMQTLWFLALCF